MHIFTSFVFIRVVLCIHVLFYVGLQLCHVYCMFSVFSPYVTLCCVFFLHSSSCAKRHVIIYQAVRPGHASRPPRRIVAKF